MYTKAEPSKTFVDIEMKLRAEQANVFLIALVSYQKSTRSLFTLLIAFRARKRRGSRLTP